MQPKSLSPNELVRVCRLAKGWKLNRLHQETGISVADLSRIENGRIRIGPGRALKFSRIFRRSVKGFYPEAGQKQVATA